MIRGTVRIRRLAVALSFAVLLGAAHAERRIAPVRPYAPVAVTPPPLQPDDALDTFRAEVVKAARGRVYAELARLTAAQGFFWLREFEGRFDPRRPGVDNLALALRLEHNGGAGWAELEQLAGEERMLPLESRPGVVCAPGKPAFDGLAFDRLVQDTRTIPEDWAYARVPDVAVRAAPRNEAPALEILGLHFVRVLDRTGGWPKVVAPGGVTGFVPPGALRTFDATLLCYGKDGTGRWSIVGVIGGRERTPQRGRN